MSLRPVFAVLLAVVFLAAVTGGFYTAKACGGGNNTGAFQNRQCAYNDPECYKLDPNKMSCRDDTCEEAMMYHHCYGCNYPGHCILNCNYPYGTCCSLACGA